MVVNYFHLAYSKASISAVVNRPASTKFTIFTKEATSALAGSSIQVQLEYGNKPTEFYQRGNPEYPQKNPWSKVRSNNKLNHWAGIEPGSC